MATQKFQDTTGKMADLCRRIVRWNLVEKARVIRRFFRYIFDRVLVCSARMPTSRYRRLSRASFPPPEMELEFTETTTTSSSRGYEDSDSDLLSLKISLLGDCQIGKTTFLIKYVGDEEEKRRLEMKGVNLMGKTLHIGGGATIAFKLWDVGGDRRSSMDQVPIACRDCVAILFMFDLTSRCTLNNIIGWYTEARKWNQSAIPIVVGTKFDEFVKLPPDIQLTVVNQARVYAKAMKATLFFSSASHNINVHKIFKFIMAKLFNLPWTVRRNLTIGEPIIDF